jgi:anthranilate phosphoribosyltransferase
MMPIGVTVSIAARHAIELVDAGHDLPTEVCGALFADLLAGAVEFDAVVHILNGLRRKGESIDELTVAARAMRAAATPIACNDPRAIDTCGTGGDGVSTFNVSTAAAIVAAAAGATVAKHGNRTNSRASGSTEVLASLGVNVEAPPAVVERCLRDVRIGYLNAALLHPAMRHVANARKTVGGRTIFNLLGPLANPAGVRRQVVGVSHPSLLEKIARALEHLSVEHALVVHGHDGLCDLTITSESTVMELRVGTIRHYRLAPEDAGLPRGEQAALHVNSPQESAATILAILEGRPGPARDHLLLNSAAALYVAGIAPSIAEGVRHAANAIDSGAALKTLEDWRSASGGDA